MEKTPFNERRREERQQSSCPIEPALTRRAEPGDGLKKKKKAKK